MASRLFEKIKFFNLFLIMKIILNAMIFVPLVGNLQNNHYGHYYLVDSFPMTPKA